jgi:RNA polymerase sigma-70 factor (ECF subfamily)
MLYDGVVGLTGSPVAALNRAAALARRAGPAAAREAVDALADLLLDYQPYWALRARLASELGDIATARAAYDEAIARAPDDATRAFLVAQKSLAASPGRTVE